MKKTILLVLAIFLILHSTNATSMEYTAKITRQNMEITLILNIETDTKANSFSRQNFPMPENSSLESIRDSLGPIKNHKLNEQSLSFVTNTGPLRNRETIEIKYLIKNFSTKEFEELNSAILSLPGLVNAASTLEVSGAKILSFESNHAIKGEIKKEKLKMEGNGAIWVKFFYSDKGKEFENFILFNQSSLTNSKIEENGLKEADSLFNIIPKTLGIALPFEKIPIIILDEKTYKNKINTYSTGVYQTGGIIVLNETEFKEAHAICRSPANATATILHEASHAFNTQATTWNNTRVVWFDEGIAKFIESTAKNLRGERNTKLFLGKNTWTEQNTTCTDSPNGKIEELNSYLQEEKEFMKEWKNQNDTTREFGYAFSELYLRELIKEKKIQELQNAYRKMLEVKEEINNEKEFSEKIIELLEKPLTPCYSKNEQEIRDCVRKLNSFEFTVPEKTTVLQLGLNDSEFESVTEKHELKKTILNQKISLFEEKLFGLIENIFNAIQKEVKK